MVGNAIPNFEYGLFYIRPPVTEEELPEADYVNNCSIMAYLRFGNATILLPGDMMTGGMDYAINTGCESRLTGGKLNPAVREKTIDPKALRRWISTLGCRFLVAPHHGLESAWPEALFDLLEESGHDVSLAIISDKASTGKGDGKVDARYSSEAYVSGYDVWNDAGKCTRQRSVSTHNKGNILVAIPQTGRANVVVSKDVDWILTEAPRAITSGTLRNALVAAY